MAAGHGVAIQGSAYNPQRITIAAGDSVTWTNNDTGTPHSATADDGSWDTGRMDYAASGTVTFANPGTFSYHCSVHPTFMFGTVSVSAGPATTAPRTTTTTAPTTTTKKPTTTTTASTTTTTTAPTSTTATTQASTTTTAVPDTATTAVSLATPTTAPTGHRSRTAVWVSLLVLFLLLAAIAVAGFRQLQRLRRR